MRDFKLVIIRYLVMGIVISEGMILLEKTVPITQLLILHGSEVKRNNPIEKRTV